MTALAVAVVVVGLLIELRRRDVAFQAERRQNARERSELLNRIKPETAQPLEHEEPVELFEHVPVTDDEGYWERAA